MPSKGWASLGAEPEKPLRYVQPQGTSCGVYMPPLLPKGHTWAQIAKDPTIPLIITEGELKAACGCILGFFTLGLGGVYSWMSRKNKQVLIPILEEFVWKDRLVNLCFDSDIEINPMVRAAAGRLAKTLADRGASVIWTALPSNEDTGEKQGMDDIAYRLGKEALDDLLAKAETIGPGAALHHLNSEVAFIRSTAEVVQLQTGIVYSATQFDLVYRDLTYKETPDKGKPILHYVARDWMEWKYRNKVTRLEYAPWTDTMITQDGAYNLFRGWKCQPSNKGSAQPWLGLIDRMLPSIDALHRKWLIQWFAYPIQYPGTKLATALLLWGFQQGTGKTLLGETMEEIYGDNYGTVSSLELDSQFNAYAMNKQFLVIDELDVGSKRQTNHFFKDMITRSTISINIKGQKQFSTKDCINYYLTSNHPNSLTLANQDRRVAVFEVDSTPLSTKEADAYINWLRNEGGAARLFWYLRHEVDTSDFAPKAQAPLTSAKIDMIRAGFNDMEDWVNQMKNDPDSVLKQPYDLFTTADLWAVYNLTLSGGPLGASYVAIMGRTLSGAGVFKVAKGNNSAKIYTSVRAQFWAVRNIARYTRVGPAEAAAAYEAERKRTPPGGVGSSKKFTGTTKGRVQ